MPLDPLTPNSIDKLSETEAPPAAPIQRAIPVE